MAKELGVSVSWLVCTDPKLADMIEGFGKLDADGQDALLATLQRALRKLAKAAPPAQTEPVSQKPVSKKAVVKKPATKNVGSKSASKVAPVRASVRKTRSQAAE
jgi:hypothetical protein